MSTIDVELDDKVVSQARLYGLIEERADGLYVTDTGREALEAYFEREWAKMPICPRCEKKAYLLKGDYLCYACRIAR